MTARTTTQTTAATTKKAAQTIAERTMRRVYLALVQGDPPASGTIDAPLGRDAKVRTRMAVTHRGKPARTTYRVLERFGESAAASPKGVAVRLRGGDAELADVVRALDAEDLALEHLQLHAPSLDDVFLTKTGRSLRES